MNGTNATMKGSLVAGWERSGRRMGNLYTQVGGRERRGRCHKSRRHLLQSIQC